MFDLVLDGSVDQVDLAFFVTDEFKLHTYFGDANLDGEFSSEDMVAVFSGREV